MTAHEIDRARSQAAAARERLIGIARELQERVRPSTLAEDAVSELKRKGGEVIDGVGRAASRRPVAVSAAAAGITALLLGRPIVRLARRWTHKDAGEGPRDGGEA